jgi:glycosyltransferase involved in cell wall biosynthesis
MAIDQKIKICHLTSVHRATDTRIFYKECRSLAKVYDVTLIALSEKSYEKDGVKIIALRKYQNRFLRFWITDFILLVKAIGQRANVYHFHDPELIVAGLALRLTGKKVIYDVHEDVVSDLDEKKWLPLKRLAKAGYYLLELIAFRFSFYFVLAEKSYEKKYLCHPSQYIVVQNFVSVKDFKFSNLHYKSDSKTIAFVGFLSARRGLAYIIEALHILKGKGLVINLRCVGTINPELLDILNKSEFYSEIKDQVEFRGYIPFPESIYAVRDCLAGLALPENLPNHYGSYPTKMFEYMAIGLPVISSDFELYKDVVDTYECGITVNPEDSVAIANAIEFLILNPEKASSYSDNAKEAVHNFDWKMEEEKLLDFYEKIIDGKI